ncbi:MAG: PLP-dependent aspartate aminotransferase family protein [Bacteroidota bacterium]
MGFATKAIHAGQAPDTTTGAIITPVFLTSTYVQEELGKNKGYEYSRVSNPTRVALEKNIAALEGGKHGMAFSSGVAATDAILHLLKPGDHAIFSRNLYGGTHRIARQVWEEYGLEFDFVDTTDLQNVRNAIRPETKLLFIETPTNPTMEVTDLRGAAEIAEGHGMLSVADNTFATPYLQRPLESGIDVVLHSLTKYLNGHSDMLGGLVVTDRTEVEQRLRFLQKSTGAILSPFDSWLCLRGTKTLHVRMRQHCENAMQIAQWLASRPGLQSVFYPGLPAHRQHLLARRQMSGFGGMIAFDVGGLEPARTILNNVRLCALAESLGSVETLITHPATMTHAAIPAEERQKIGITDGLIRVSVGIEDVEDIVADLDSAFRKAGLY